MCIGLISFYTTVECVERKLNPMTTNLVVAYPELTEKTISFVLFHQQVLSNQSDSGC